MSLTSRRKTLVKNDSESSDSQDVKGNQMKRYGDNLQYDRTQFSLGFKAFWVVLVFVLFPLQIIFAKDLELAEG